ncbi:putative F-box/LRR-repeat protein 9 [Impatiens glandulifera]|uniref:putative F-box/LRR-repeat protein 9 n=1 Tax=Impatiens glandulifera TaxID=253017 RepID=UPI001FB13D8A|nr:putative F-box/LRR-repeat protein 9 [Impatiens glandulifera]
MAKRFHQYRAVGRALPSETDEHPKLWATNGDREASTSKTITFEKEVGESRNWVEGLPHDVTVAILQKVGVIDILENVQLVCTSWHEICQDPALWRSIDMCRRLCSINHYYTSYEMFEIIKQAIDRSCGQLIDFSLEHDCNDDILKYITDRKNQLRRLKLVTCLDITNHGLSEAAKMMPSMEELHLHFGSITEVGLENVGCSCPGLKSLTHNRNRAVDDPNSEALAISRTMTQLRHLSLVGNSMTNTGLQAILDACPHLESLDLRKCNNVDLSGELGKKCSSIKTFRHPNEFVGQNEGGRFFDDNDDDNDYVHHYYYHSNDNDATGFIADYEGFLY